MCQGEKGEEGEEGVSGRVGRGGCVKERRERRVCQGNNTTRLEGEDRERDKGKKDREKKGLTS